MSSRGSCDLHRPHESTSRGVPLVPLLSLRTIRPPSIGEWCSPEKDPREPPAATGRSTVESRPSQTGRAPSKAPSTQRRNGGLWLQPMPAGQMGVLQPSSRPLYHGRKVGRRAEPTIRDSREAAKGGPIGPVAPNRAAHSDIDTATVRLLALAQAQRADSSRWRKESSCELAHR